VCIRLKDLVERLFPRRSKQRRNEVEEEERGEHTCNHIVCAPISLLVMLQQQLSSGLGVLVKMT
jgi:hypothetical protein